MAMLAPRTQRFTPPSLGPWTYEQYCALPDDGQRYEIIWGELHVAPAPNLRHQHIVLRLGRYLDEFCDQHGLGRVLVAPTDVVLPYQTVVQPDLLFVRADRALSLADANITIVPDLVVEVLSPSTSARDLGEKRDAYTFHGVPHYWIVNPRTRTIEAYELRKADYVLIQHAEGDEAFSPALFPGLSIPLAKLWE